MASSKKFIFWNYIILSIVLGVFTYNKVRLSTESIKTQTPIDYKIVAHRIEKEKSQSIYIINIQTQKGNYDVQISERQFSRVLENRKPFIYYNLEDDLPISVLTVLQNQKFFLGSIFMIIVGTLVYLAIQYAESKLVLVSSISLSVIFLGAFIALGLLLSAPKTSVNCQKTNEKNIIFICPIEESNSSSLTLKIPNELSEMDVDSVEVYLSVLSLQRDLIQGYSSPNR